MSKLKLGKDHILDQEVELMVKESIASNNVPIVGGEFDKQLAEFKKDTSYKERFRRCELDDLYGIEIFMFKPKKEAAVGLLLVDNGRTKNTKDLFHATNIAKIIKVGVNIKEPKYKVGDLVLLPYAQVTGLTPNPKHAMYHQLDDSNYKPILNEAIPEMIHTFVVTLGGSAFLPPQEFDVEDEDIKTYTAYQDFIIGKYNF